MYVTFWEYQFGETQLLQGTTQLIQHAKYYKAARPRYPLKVGTKNVLYFGNLSV